VEIEVNGMMTYDRELGKMDARYVAAANASLYLPPPIERVILPTAEREKAAWRYTTGEPGEGWIKPDFDDHSWKTGPGGFGTADTPGAIVGTEWTGTDIWLRRAFEFEGTQPSLLYLRLYHDEDCEVYLNGKPVAEKKGYVTSYRLVPLYGVKLNEGKNTLAIHCRQTQGGQGIDAGLVELIERE
jgi:hypothetical protein